MEAPKKIYLQENTTTDCYGEFWPEWFEARAKDSDIEYVCKDAFIEKACEWLSKHFYDDVYEIRDDEGTSIDADLLIEDFENYMKEE